MSWKQELMSRIKPILEKYMIRAMNIGTIYDKEIDKALAQIKTLIEQTELVLDEGAIKGIIDKLSDEKRIELFSNYCVYCGCDDPKCQCWNDE